MLGISVSDLSSMSWNAPCVRTRWLVLNTLSKAPSDQNHAFVTAMGVFPLVQEEQLGSVDIQAMASAVQVSRCPGARADRPGLSPMGDSGRPPSTGTSVSTEASCIAMTQLAESELQRSGRNFLKGHLGDQINAVISAVGYNLRPVLKWPRKCSRKIIAESCAAMIPQSATQSSFLTAD